MTLHGYHHLRAEEEKQWDRGRTELALQANCGDPDFTSDVERLLPPAERQPYDPGALIDVKRDPPFDQIMHLCERYRDASVGQRAYIRSRIDSKAGGRLASFGLRAAVLGAREKSLDRIRLSLIAFAIADLAGRDVRDALIGLSLLYRCASLAGGSASELFQEAARLSGSAMEAVFRDYGGQSPGSMGWREVDTPDGVGFRQGFSKP